MGRVTWACVMKFGSLFVQARRRRVFRTAGLYIVGAWLLLQITALAFPALSIPEESIRFVWIAAILGFPVAIVFGWRYDVRDGRIVRTSNVVDDSPLSLQRPDYLILGPLGATGFCVPEISDNEPATITIATIPSAPSMR